MTLSGWFGEFFFLGVILKPSKCAFCNPLSFWGLLGTYPNRANQWSLSIALTIDKIRKRSAEIDHFSPYGRIRRSELQKIIGSFRPPNPWRSVNVREIYFYPYIPGYMQLIFDPEISPQIAEIFRWWVRLLRPLQPRIVSIAPCFPGCAIFTDASYKQGACDNAAFFVS